MKKSLLMLLILLLLVGCSNKKEENPKIESSSNQTTESKKAEKTAEPEKKTEVPANSEMFGRDFINAAAIGETVEIPNEFSNRIEGYKVTKIYKDEETLKKVKQDDKYKQFISYYPYLDKVKKLNHIVVEYEQTYLKDTSDQKGSISQDETPYIMAWSNKANGYTVGDERRVDFTDYQPKELKTGETRTHFGLIVLSDEEAETLKYVVINKAVFDINPEIKAGFIKVNETDTALYGTMIEDESDVKDPFPFYDIKLKSVETSDQAREDYWKIYKEEQSFVKKDNPDYKYTKIVVEVSWPKDRKNDVVDWNTTTEINAYNPSATDDSIWMGSSLKFRNKLSDSNDPMDKEFVHPGETKEFTMFLLNHKDLKPYEIKQYLIGGLHRISLFLDIK